MLEDKFNPVQRPIEFDLSSAIPQSEDTGVSQYAFSEPLKRNNKRKQNSSFDNGNDATGDEEHDVSGVGEKVESDDLCRFD